MPKDEIDKEVSLRYWWRIYRIEQKAHYSYYEIDKLVKDIERYIPKTKKLIEYLDLWYKDGETAGLHRRIILLTHFRQIFHNPIRKTSKDPLPTVNHSKLNKNHAKLAKRDPSCLTVEK